MKSSNKPMRCDALIIDDILNLCMWMDEGEKNAIFHPTEGMECTIVYWNEPFWRIL